MVLYLFSQSNHYQWWVLFRVSTEWFSHNEEMLNDKRTLVKLKTISN